MSGPPLPGPYDEDDEHDTGLTGWEEQLEWAERGDLMPLIASLRSAQSCGNPNVLTFLADVLDGKIKRPRGKPVKRPNRTWWIDSNGRPQMIDERDKRRYQIARWIREHKAEHGKRVFEAAATQFGIEENALVDMMRRSLKAIKKKRST
jgi:hypothetical protein